MKNMFTLGNWILLAVLILASAVIALYIGSECDEVLPGIVAFLVCVIITGVIMGVIAWYNTHTASGIRALKDYKSELSNGIDREIRITAEDGREIFYYEGKVDVESNHTDNYIKFESEDGKRYIIYYGIQDTITIIEK